MWQVWETRDMRRGFGGETGGKAPNRKNWALAGG